MATKSAKKSQKSQKSQSEQAPVATDEQSNPPATQSPSTTDVLLRLAVEEMLATIAPGQPIPIHLWGKDHWSTFGYAECRLVDNKGTIDNRHMRGDFSGHDAGYPTRLAAGVTRPNHGDYDCLFDAESAGLLELGGTGLHPFIKSMTPKGAVVAAALRNHKANGGSFGNFKFGG